MRAESRMPLQGHSSFRWLETPTVDVRRNLAMEEAIFWSDQGPTVRLWENQRSVIIGRGQYAAYETDLEYCAARAIPVVRRFTGGGAVYNGPGNLNWSFFVGSGVGSGWVRFERGAREIFRMASAVVIEVLERLGVHTWLDEPNRILTVDGKVSGMAAFLTKEKLLCHGTLLLSSDLEEAQLLTKPRALPVEDRYVRSRNVRVANLGVSADSFARGLRGLISAGGSELGAPEGPRGRELELVERLMPKYHSADWNLGDPFLVGGGRGGGGGT